jgi:hypothetical protein
MRSPDLVEGPVALDPCRAPGIRPAAGDAQLVAAEGGQRQSVDLLYSCTNSSFEASQETEGQAQQWTKRQSANIFTFVNRT